MQMRVLKHLISGLYERKGPQIFSNQVLRCYEQMFLGVKQLYSALLGLRERLNGVDPGYKQAMSFLLLALQSGIYQPLATTTTHITDRLYHISLSSYMKFLF